MITSSNFKNYPVQILGIDGTYDAELAAMEVVAKRLLSYSGDILDVANVIVYLVYLLFWNDKNSVTTVTGESRAVKEFTEMSSFQKDMVLSLARKEMRGICDEKGTTADFNVFKMFYGLL